MRPKSIDDVIVAYEVSVRNLHAIEDRLRAASAHVVRVQGELSAQLKLVAQLRADVERFTAEVAA